jgi:hypothetical protein
MLSCNLHLVLNGDYLNFITTKNLFYFTAQYFLKKIYISKEVKVSL